MVRRNLPRQSARAEVEEDVAVEVRLWRFAKFAPLGVFPLREVANNDGRSAISIDQQRRDIASFTSGDPQHQVVVGHGERSFLRRCQIQADGPNRILVTVCGSGFKTLCR